MFAPPEETWATLTGGYRMPYDPRPAIDRLDSPERAEAWEELWTELHHQSDVGPASYAAVPLLVERQERVRDGDWQPYAMVGIIELARTLAHNPPMPEWLHDYYFASIGRLGELAIQELPQASSDEQLSAMMGVFALSRGSRPRAQLLIQFGNDELEDLIGNYHGG